MVTKMDIYLGIYICINAHIYANTYINNLLKKEVINFKESKKEYMEGIIGRKGRLYYNHKNKRIKEL